MRDQSSSPLAALGGGGSSAGGSVQLSISLPRPQPGAERQDSLADRLCALLARRGRPLEVGHIAAQLLRLRQCPERLQRRLVAEIVDGDERLAWHARDLVGLAPRDWRATGLAGATFCVVDLETTGGSPGSSKVTEIGAVRVSGAAIVDRFSVLVDPGRPIPPIVSALTGIDDEMVRGQPDIEGALARFVGFAGDDVLVAHNAPFDLRFLNYERRRLAGRYFTQPWLDTLTLARRLLGGSVPRHDLATLAEWADTRVRPVHRALPDAEATGELLVRMLGMLAERGVDTLERAVAFAATSAPRHAHKLALAEDLPSDPGVYLMLDRHGSVLYVGKAANLRRRVRSYFGPGGRHGRLIGRALERLDTVHHETCGSELEARLRESRLIRELRPPCNSRGMAVGGHYLKLTAAEPYPRLFTTPRAGADGADYFGPVRSDRRLRTALELLHALFPLRRCHHLCALGAAAPDDGACAGPCAADGGAGYAASIAPVRALLAGEPAALPALGRALREAAAEGRWSADDDGRERLAALLGVVTGMTRLRRAAAHPFALVESGEVCDVAVAFFVARGRVVHRAELRRGAWRSAARAGMRALLHAEAAPPEPFPAEGIDEALILAERLRERGGHPAAVRLEPGWTSAGALVRIERALAAVLPPPDLSG